MSDAREVRRAAVVMVILVIVWGYSWVLSKVGLRFCGPLDFATLRTALGALTLLPALLWLRKPLRPQHPRYALTIGLIQTAGFLLLNNYALSLGEAGKTAILVFTMPFWVLILGWPVLGERIDIGGWIAVGLAAIGLVFLLEPWAMRAAWLANILAVLAGVCWALGVVFAKKLHNREPVDSFNFTFWQMLFGVIPMTIIATATHSRPIQWTPEFIAIFILLGVFATAGGWMMWLYVLHRMPAGTASMGSLAIPVIALVSSAIQLGERPHASELTGMAFIVVALAIVSWVAISKHLETEPLMGQE